MDRKKTGEEIMRVLSYNNILVVGQLVTFPESHHAVKRRICSHHDLNMPEFVNVFDDRRCLQLAVFTLWVKKDQQDGRLFI